MRVAPGTWPDWYSWGSRTSMIATSSRSSISFASAALIRVNGSSGFFTGIKGAASVNGSGKAEMFRHSYFSTGGSSPKSKTRYHRVAMPAKPRILVTRPLPPPAIKRLEAVAEVQVLDGERPSNETLREQSADKHGILALLGARVDEQLIRGAPRLYAVSNLGTGYDNIDVDAASKHGVLVTRTPGVLTETTADLTFALILDVARRVSEGDRFVRAGTWASGQQLPFGRDVHGATLGIIGLGNIGTAVARRGRAFGMNVLYHSRTHKPAMERRLRLKYLSLDDLLKQSDFVVLLAALTPQTKGMIGEKQLRMMKPGAMLIN